MKVLSLVPGLDPRRGGMASATARMVLAARKAGAECVVAVPDHAASDNRAHALMDELKLAGVVVHALPTLSRPRGLAYRWGISPAQAVWAGRHVQDFDVIHVHGIWGIGPLSGLFTGRFLGTPVVVTAHESLTAFDIDDSRTTARRLQKLLLKSLYLRLTTLFVLTSELEAADSLPSDIPQRTVRYPLVDAEDPLPPLASRGVGEGLRLGFLARIDPKKNLDLLIDAMANLPSDIQLVIAGDGPPDLVDALRRRGDQRGVSGRLEWLGFVEPGERSRLLNTIDLLAMPSDFESFGLSAAEAMAEGVPVLVSERTGIAEVIRRRGGGIVCAADVASIAESIREVASDRASLSELGARGQAAIQAELDYRRIGEDLLDAYHAAIALHGRRDATPVS